MDFSLFFFGDDADSTRDGYRLLMEGARFADEQGFAAVWTPERHFHRFGGRYSSPAVLAAAVAAATTRIAIRAGSVVAPLHHPVRIAEDWSVVDNLSGGRAGVAFASGWHAADFTLRPENYADRKQVLVDTVEMVRRLWRRESIDLVDGSGDRATIRTYPAPTRPDLPIWLTSAGHPETFRTAGRLGTGVLTHLLGQEPDELAEKIGEYRRALPVSAGPGHVVLMLHTFLGDDREVVRDKIREPFSAYLRSSIELITRNSANVLPGVNLDELTPEEVDFMVDLSFNRYFDTGGLFGTTADATRMLERLSGIGVDEVACLIDFVGDTHAVLAGLRHLAELRRIWSATTSGE
jgi:natural product biosynthesis luciferase-like monooxygenase protein